MSNNIITGVALLEAFWNAKRKDLLDLISPFIVYGVSKNTSVGDIVDVNKVAEYVQNEFGLTDLPNSVVEKIINRDKERFEKKNKTYVLAVDLGTDEERLENRRCDCVRKIEIIKLALFEYLNSHCKYSKITSPDHAIDLLQKFFSRFSLQISLNKLENETFHSREDEINYYIAQYIYEAKEGNSSIYHNIVDLTKGYLLQSAIYLQVDNYGIKDSDYKDTTIYCDTPYLIKLLGYEDEESKKSACQLHALLKRQGANLKFFNTAETEIISILTAYQYSISGNRKITRTLEGLDKRGYTPEGVIRIKNSFVKRLEEEFDITLCDLPPFPKDDYGSIDVNSIDIDENEAMKYVADNTVHYSEDNLRSDVSSALAIHRIRNGYKPTQIEKCKALFLTTNPAFTKAFNQFYKNSVDRVFVPLVITSFDLSAITWVKCGITDSEIPEVQLLSNAFSAYQPSSEILNKCESELSRLQSEGKITAEDALLLRADRVTQKELWAEKFPTVNEINEEYIQMLKKKQEAKIQKNIAATIEEKYRNKDSEMQLVLKKKAREYAKIKKDRRIKIIKTITIIGSIALLVASCIGAFYSSNTTNHSIIVKVCCIICGVLSFASTIDLISGKMKFFQSIIEKHANQIETKTYEEKLKEYGLY